MSTRTLYAVIDKNGKLRAAFFEPAKAQEYAEDAQYHGAQLNFDCPWTVATFDEVDFPKPIPRTKRGR